MLLGAPTPIRSRLVGARGWGTTLCYVSQEHDDFGTDRKSLSTESKLCI